MTQKTELAPDTLGQAPSRLYDRYIFDLDGTIYLGKSLLPGAYRMITKLRELNKRVVFLSKASPIHSLQGSTYPQTSAVSAPSPARKIKLRLG